MGADSKTTSIGMHFLNLLIMFLVGALGGVVGYEVEKPKSTPMSMSMSSEQMTVVMLAPGHYIEWQGAPLHVNCGTK